jgi:hypothetical protein
VIDVGYHKIAITEAMKLGIPIVAVVDTNHSPIGIAHVIPGNDDSSRAIRLYARGAADAILEGRSDVIQEIVQAARSMSRRRPPRPPDGNGASDAPRRGARRRAARDRPVTQWRSIDMAEIAASMVMDLRQRTGLGMMECKKALTEAGGDLGKAEELLRIKSGAKASKAAGRIAAEGVIGLYVAPDRKSAAMVEVNCETDFVAKNEDFRAFASEVAEIIARDNPAMSPRSAHVRSPRAIPSKRGAPRSSRRSART